MRKLSQSPLVFAMVPGALPSLTQGGSPFITDDPATPGNRKCRVLKLCIDQAAIFGKGTLESRFSQMPPTRTAYGNAIRFAIRWISGMYVLTRT
jgi:hypothetical protein